MKLFFEYLKQRRSGIILFLIFSIIFSVVFVLYNITFKAVLYPFLLCLAIGVVFFIFDFLSVKKKHEKLCEIRHLTSSMIDNLPKIKSIDEADYQKLIKNLTDEISDIEYKSSMKYHDMIDYYTVWAHQIKTPITSMRLSLEREDTALSRKLKSDLFQIEQYVEMVLCYLRLDADSTDYVIKEYELDELIRQAVRKYAASFIRKKLRLEYAPVNCRVLTDEKWMLFVLEQVLSNALKYTKAGSISISQESPGILCIRDTGIGIAPEDLPRIFEKGYTGYNGRSDKKASGIGLYLCKRICRNLGHRITAESAVGTGTVIRIDFRRAELEVE
ncbi:MAG TPA: hypothetical protein DEF06_05345 [Clostridiales bacterium]|nr:hypothetical protein [Clostridiales bacterium]